MQDVVPTWIREKDQDENKEFILVPILKLFDVDNTSKKQGLCGGCDCDEGREYWTDSDCAVLSIMLGKICFMTQVIQDEEYIAILWHQNGRMIGGGKIPEETELLFIEN